jgi:outer membrane lipase/esterase
MESWKLMESKLWAVRAWRKLGLVLAAAGLLSCGGGTQQIEPFIANKVIVLGDETNLLTSISHPSGAGLRYGINGLDSTNAFDCRSFPIWTQSLASIYNLVFDECNPSALSTNRATMRAAFNAKAFDLDAQIDAQIASAAPTAKDLFTVLVGMHDVIELYETYTGPMTCDPETDNNTPLEVELRLRGEHVAQQVNRLISLGARVIVSTIPDLGLSPYARVRDALSPGQAALLSCMTAAFNSRVRVKILQDGRFVGLVLADELSQLMVKQPANYGLANVTSGACTVAVPDCTNATLQPLATSGSHLWADDRRIGPVAQSQIASLAVARARANPF